MRLLCIAVLALAAVGVGCSDQDPDAAKREAERKAIEDKKKLLAEVTKPDPEARKPKKAPSKEQLIAGCERGDAASCQGACILEHGESCTQLGVMFETGEGGVPEKIEEAMVFHRKACDLGTGSGCYALALFYKLGKSIPKSPKKAKRYFTKGCEVGFEPACLELEEATKKKKKK